MMGSFELLFASTKYCVTAINLIKREEGKPAEQCVLYQKGVRTQVAL